MSGTDRPILFSGPMVCALLDGRKTQTRRIMPHHDAIVRHASAFRPIITRNAVFNYAGDEEISRAQYAVGDRLWVKEALSRNPVLWTYTADGAEVGWPARRDLASRERNVLSSRFMLKSASRLTLAVTDVRVQRLQEISEADAVAEGCFKGKASGRVFENSLSMHLGGDQWANARDWYADLWDSLNAKRGYGWEANPWLVAVTFTVERRNIDEVRHD